MEYGLPLGSDYFNRQSAAFFIYTTSRQNTASNPYEIKADSEILSIYDDKTKFEENGFKIFYNGISLSDDNDFAGFISWKDNRILIDNDVISTITVYSESIITYNMNGLCELNEMLFIITYKMFLMPWQFVYIISFKVQVNIQCLFAIISNGMKF